ncbi:hypothetical protein VTG60DRAFT_3491 [Thermothelomyces hinnuleus]
MAATLFKAVLAIGLKTTAFLQSLFLFPFNTVLRVVQLFPSFRQTDQPILPCSTSGPTSSSSAGEARNISNNKDDDVGDGGCHNETGMAHAASASTASARVSSIVPALPRAPPPSGRENHAPAADTPVKADAQLDAALSRLDANGAGLAGETRPGALQSVIDGTGSTTGDGTGKSVTAHDGTALPQQQPDRVNWGDGTPEGVTRAPPIPLTHTVSQASRLKETAPTMQPDGPTVLVNAKTETPEQAAEKAMHSRFMREALDMARLALRTNETPVGCVLVYKGRVIARGMNATNVTRNGTRHAELMAISALLSYAPAADLEPAKGAAAMDKATGGRMPLGDRTNETQVAEETSTWGDVDPRDGHLYPYGQKLHPSPRVDPSVITECILYVTVEPCVMCASLLRQLGIKKVYFGAVNDKFGGTGGVFSIHKNSPYSMASAPPSPAPQNGKGIPRPVLEPRPASTDVVTEKSTPADGTRNEEDLCPNPIDTSTLPGDGGNIERGFEAEGGWGRDEAVTLLRQFYVQENNRAPVPRKKEGRAARLAAMMERDGRPIDMSLISQENSGTSTPAKQESAAGEPAESIAV